MQINVCVDVGWRTSLCKSVQKGQVCKRDGVFCTLRGTRFQHILM